MSVRLLAGTLLAWSSTAFGMSVSEINDLSRDRIAHMSVRDGKGEEQSSGTGFVISSSGRLATNYHVIEDASSVAAVFPDKREVQVSGVWAYDRDIDLAILQLEPGKYEPLQLAADPGRESEEIVLIGSALGLGNSVTTGIISAVRERGVEKTSHREGQASWGLQITAAASHGSSGSPVLRTSSAEVVGVLVGGLSGLEGQKFAIPVSHLHSLLAKAPAQPLELNSATGARSVQTNLMISGAFLAGVALLWVAGTHLHQRRQARGARAKR